MTRDINARSPLYPKGCKMPQNKLLEEALMCRTLSTLIKGGVPILESINLTAEAHPYFSEGLKYIHDAVREGDTMSEPMQRQNGLFHPFTKNMTHIGEETGALEKTLYAASEFLERQHKAERFKDKDLQEAMFYHAFGTLVEEGMPVLRAVRTMKEVSTYIPPEVLGRVENRITGGETLSEAMSKEREYFSPFVQNMVAAGECGGVLDILMKEVAVYLEKRCEIKWSNRTYGERVVDFFKRLGKK